MMAGSTCSNQRPDTLMQGRIASDRRNLLHRTAGPYIGSRVRISPDEGSDADRRNAPKPDANSTDWWISMNQPRGGSLNERDPGRESIFGGAYPAHSFSRSSNSA